MTDDIRQPTLIAPQEDSKAPDPGRLTLVDLVAARVLELSSTESAPLTPSPRLTRHLLAGLAQRGVIRLTSENEGGVNNDSHVRSVYEAVSWKVCVGRPFGNDAKADLRRYVDGAERRETIRREQLDLWLTLGAAELESYARHLLRDFRHPELVIGRVIPQLELVLRKVAAVSVRRALWIHFRGPSCDRPSSFSEAEGVRFADQLAARICATALRVHGHSTTLQFVPTEKAPAPLIRRVFAAEATSLKQRYWACTPTLSALES